MQRWKGLKCAYRWISPSAVAAMSMAELGCREASRELSNTGTQQSAIVDGDPVDPVALRFPAVGAVLESRTDTLGVHTCTGTLLCPTAVLTAAHCFDDVTPASRIWFATAENVRDVAAELLKTSDAASAVCDLTTGPCSAVSARWVHPEYRPPTRLGMRTRQFDLAVVRLEKPISLPKYPKIATAAPSTCSDLVAVGYGQTSKGESMSSGLMHQGLLRYVEPNRSLVNKGFGYYGTLTFKPGLLATVGKRPRVAFGDSGGPIMDTDSATLVAGTLELLDASIFGVANNEIDNASYYAPVHSHRAAIEAAAAAYCGGS